MLCYDPEYYKGQERAKNIPTWVCLYWNDSMLSMTISQGKPSINWLGCLRFQRDSVENLIFMAVGSQNLFHPFQAWHAYSLLYLVTVWYSNIEICQGILLLPFKEDVYLTQHFLTTSSVWDKFLINLFFLLRNIPY